MSFPIPTAPLPKLFYTLAELRAIGGPARTNAYKLAKGGQLKIVAIPGLGRGVTADEAQRFFASGRPLAEVKRNTSKGAAASLAARGAAE